MDRSTDRVCTLLTFDSQDITYASLVVNDSITEVTREQTRQGRSRVQLQSSLRIMERSINSIPSEGRDLIALNKKIQRVLLRGERLTDSEKQNDSAVQH